MKSRIAIALALVGAACSSATGPTGDILSEAETQAITEAVLGVALSEGLGSGLTASPAAAEAYVPVQFNFSVDETAPCQAGGTIRVNGSISGEVDSEASSGSLSVNLTETLASCGISTVSYGVFTVSTPSSIRLEGSMEYGPQGPVGTSSFTYKGTFAWEHADGRSGTCPIDLSLSWSSTSASYSGTVCNNTYEASVTVGA